MTRYERLQRIRMALAQLDRTPTEGERKEAAQALGVAHLLPDPQDEFDFPASLKSDTGMTRMPAARGTYRPCGELAPRNLPASTHCWVAPDRTTRCAGALWLAAPSRTSAV